MAEKQDGRKDIGNKTDGTSEVTWLTNIFCSQSIKPDFADLAQKIGDSLDREVWLLVQSRTPSQLPKMMRGYDELGGLVRNEFHAQRNTLPRKKIAVLIDSPGGSAQASYQIALFLRRHCGGFTAIVPEYAKSAATLLCLGADEILLGNDAELGPLDVQVFEPDREQFASALDEVQSLERLHAFAMEAIDKHMSLLRARSGGMKIRTLLPEVQQFIGSMVRPLFEKIDTVHYTMMSRMLKVAEAYAFRLLKPKYTPKEAERIARALVHNYPEHAFVIDRTEASLIGLKVTKPTDEQDELLQKMKAYLGEFVAIGKMEKHDL